VNIFLTKFMWLLTFNVAVFIMHVM